MRDWHGIALAVAALGGIVVAGALMFSSSEAVTLVADGPLKIYDHASADPSQISVIATLETGLEVQVTNCVDLKHYIVPEVVLADGRTGYVIDGRFHLRREPSSSLSGKSAPRGC